MGPEPAMVLRFEKYGENGRRIFLDEKEIRRVSDFRVESSSFRGEVELTLKIMVRFPGI